MTRVPLLAASLLLTAVPALLGAPDLSRYRGFRLGSPLRQVVQQARRLTTDIKTIHARPAVLQDLTWEPRFAETAPSPSDPVESVLLSFYNGELYRLAVSYDRQRVEGLTTKDMVDALSQQYGAATYPTKAEILFPSFLNETVPVLARWEDAQYSHSLVRTSYPPVFGVVSVSKRLASLAQTATLEAVRIEEQEAPARDRAALQQQVDEDRQKAAKARPGNKATFRP